MQQTGLTAFTGQDVLLHHQACGKSLLDGGQSCGFQGQRSQKVIDRITVKATMNTRVKWLFSVRLLIDALARLQRNCLTVQMQTPLRCSDDLIVDSNVPTGRKHT